MQEGLSRYERSAGRVAFRGAEANLAEAISALEADTASRRKRPAWQRALASGAAAALRRALDAGGRGGEAERGKKGEAWRVGLPDGRILPLSIASRRPAQARALTTWSTVNVAEGKGKAGARAELRVRPTVQGAAVVLENKTGRMLAMAGGFSYPLSQLNRATQARAAARLRDQAADLSGRARQAACSPTRW